MRKVLTVGVFDYFHLGHLRLFEAAKEQGDYLIVAVQDGDCILKTKPNANVLYTTEQRVHLIESLRVVDEVLVYQDVDTFLPGVDFDIFAKGPDQVHAGFQRAVAWCEENGKDVVVLPRTPGISSSDIKKQLEELH
ncbi:MAG: adenylyltransferase/cytidyltransferase family protein [Atopobiaceae bacterium]|nr:adenylyltransferase/cytidyltransferase family protein [Atopobiaceae bacterium]MBQ6524428.1 adenylyltransferase/cytidyltransferase family protein [Atopobiaceae bacterium]